MSIEGSPPLPSGTVTFVFTDMERSTVLLQSVGEQRYAQLLADHHDVLRTAFQNLAGVEFESEGEAFFVAFRSAGQAVAAALAGQIEMANIQPEVKVRMGIHTGHVSVTATGYVGLPLHQTARISAAGHGGQVLISEATRALVEATDLPDGAGFLDLGEHRFKDLTAPLRVYQLTHPELAQEFPSIRSLEARAHNLPIQLTSLVGRDREIEEVSRMLESNRLVSLTGAAGCGKTRLALHVAAELLDRYPDGVWLAELSQSSDPEDVPMRVAEAVGLRLEAGSSGEGADSPDVIQSLKLYLAQKQLLLVLDNCEHLLTACAQLSQALLQACPGVKILTTSREALGVAGESAMRVPSLSVPDPVDPPPLDEIAQYEAVRLFVERASLVEPGFGITDDSSEAVVQICHRLDGMPLGIELAAAKVRVLTPRQIAGRLDEMFRMLTGGGRVALERQQTLRAAVDWSYRLLSEPEKLLLQRLSVFVGGFDLEAAEEVCSGEGIDKEEVLDLLTHLVDASFVVRQVHRGESRYRLLETIRQYAREKLFDSERGSEIRNRHLEYYLLVASRMSDEMLTRSVRRGNEIADDEAENLFAALDWTIGEGRLDEALRLCYNLALVWSVRRRFWEIARQYQEALGLSAGQQTLARADALALGGDIFAFRGHPEAREMAREAVELFRHLGHRPGLGRALSCLGRASFILGDTKIADDAFNEALPLLEETGQKWWKAMTLLAMVSPAWIRGERDQALARAEEAFRFAKQNRLEWPMIDTGVAVGRLRQDRGDLEGARSVLSETLALAEELELPFFVASILLDLGGGAQDEGHQNEAESFFERALGAARASGQPMTLGMTLDQLAYEAHLAGNFQKARSFWEEALEILPVVGAPAGLVAQAVGTLGWATMREGDLAAARPRLEEFLTVARTMESKLHLSNALNNLGALNRWEGDIEEARRLFEESLEVANEAEAKILVAYALSGLGEVARLEGHPDTALEHLREALRLFRDYGNKRGIRETLQALGVLAAATGKSREASRLLGAAQASFEATGAAVPPIMARMREEAMARIKLDLSLEEFEAEWEKGRAMDPDEALNYAMEEDLSSR